MKKRFVVLIIFAVIIVLGCILFVSTRYSTYTTYIPFSGRIFSITENEVSAIRIQQAGDISDYSEQSDLQGIVETLNSFRYNYWIPDIPLEMQGWDYRIVIYNGDDSVSYYFGDKSITVNGIIYVCPEEYINQLKALL